MKLSYKTNVFIFLIFVSGCVSFDKRENALLNTYKVDSVLVFKSIRTGKEKAFKVTGIEKIQSGYSEGHFGPEIDGDVQYSQLNCPRNSGSIFQVFKDNDGTVIDILFENVYAKRYNGIGFFYNDSIFINNKIFTNYCIIDVDTFFSKNFSDTELIRIFWQKDIGIIKYDLYNGDSFERINM